MNVRTIGSLSRGTAVDGASDGDHLAVLRQSEARWGEQDKSSDTVLCHVRDALQERYPNTPVTINGPCVQVHFADGAADITPAIWDGTAPNSGHPVYRIPDGDGGWMHTSPDADAKYLRDANERSGGKLNAAARGLKAFRERNDKPVPLKGLYVEAVMATCGVAEGPGKSHTRILRDALNEMARTNCADIPNPSGVGDPIRCASTAAQRDQVRVQVARAAERANRAVEAEDRGDSDEARRQWSMIYNDDI